MSAISRLKQLEADLAGLTVKPENRLESMCVRQGILLMDLYATLELMRTAVAMGSSTLDVDQISRALSAAAKRAEERLKG